MGGLSIGQARGQPVAWPRRADYHGCQGPKMQRFAWLVLFAAPAWSAGAFFNILDYGARNDASAPATEAIRAAIQAANAAGGGTVFIPAGNYVSGPIEP